jgi:hypothetical protein
MQKTIRKYDERTRALTHSHEIILSFFFSTASGGLFFFSFFIRITAHEVSNHGRIVVAIVFTSSSESCLGFFVVFSGGLSVLFDHGIASNGGVVQHLFNLLGITTTFSW